MRAMRHLSRAFKRFMPLVTYDEFFGRITYQRMKNGKSYWECSRVFAPSGESIQLSVDAPETRNDPTRNNASSTLGLSETGMRHSPALSPC